MGGSGLARGRLSTLVLGLALVTASMVAIPTPAIAAPLPTAVPKVGPVQSPSQPVLANARESFVEASYRDFLGRQPTSSELSAQSGALSSGSVSVSTYLNKLSTSYEWLGAIVTKMYRDTLQRDPDGGGMTGWTNALRWGSWSVAQEASYFYASDEYYQRFAGNSASPWVTLLYQKLLNRDPEPAGLAYWVQQTNDPRYGRMWVASNFYQSTESRTRRVEALYQALLFREPDATGWPYWTNTVWTTGDLVLATQIAGSQEYWERAIVRFPTVSEPLGIRTSSMPDGDVGVPYSTAIVATGGTPPYKWAADGLPSGLHMDPSTGVISGTPTSWLANGPVNIYVYDPYSLYAATTISLTVRADPVIGTTSLMFAVVGSLYAATLSTSSGSSPPYAWSASGLPSGLSVNPATGALSGTPTTTGSYPVTLTLTDGRAKSVDKVVTLVVRTNEVVQQVSVGESHTCALTSAGAVRCWGRNYDGQLGDGTLDDGTVPRDVTGLTNGVIAISAGATHTCAITSAGGVKCWGDNGMGQLGNGTVTSSSTPVDVVGLSSGAVAISAGGQLTCALTSAGGVKCWGLRFGGGLGDGSTRPSRIPVDVAGLSSGVSAIAAGGGYACALTTGGAVKCWGHNSSGQLGDGTAVTLQTAPVDVSGLSSGVVAISADASHTCAVMSDGGARCWGANAYGQLGDVTTVDRRTPVAVVGLPSGATSIAAGESYTCTVAGGAANCWGYNVWGQLGDGTTTDRSTPATVVGMSSGIAAVDANVGHTCAVTSRGGVKCWGDNSNGDLGNGSSWGRSLVPVDVYGFTMG